MADDSAKHLSALSPLSNTPRHPSRPPTSSHRSMEPSYFKAMKLDESDGKRSGETLCSVQRSSNITTEYPVLSSRQGDMNTPRRSQLPESLFRATSPPVSTSPVRPHYNDKSSVNPINIPLPETPFLEPRLANPPIPSSCRSASTSFNMLAAADLSLLGDCKLPSAHGDISEDSFDFGVQEIKPMNRKARISILPQEARSKGEKCDLPVKRETRSILDQSTILPTSPIKHGLLLASTNALSRVAPPWEDLSTEVPFDSMSTSRSMNFGGSMPRSTSKTKRTFPASSSAQSLASVGEETDTLAKPTINAGDVSTLLPTTPGRIKHLLDPVHNLQDEDFSLIEGADGPSLFFPSKPLPRSNSTFMPPPLASIPGSARRTPRGQRHAHESPVKEMDLTLDVKALMARMTKPKRASGTEESFMDLLHAQHDAQSEDE